MKFLILTISNFTSNYIPEYVPNNLKWYERDGLMTYIDQLKYNSFVRNTDEHFEKTQAINFDIIRRLARGENLMRSSNKIIKLSMILGFHSKKKKKKIRLYLLLLLVREKIFILKRSDEGVSFKRKR